MTADQLQRVVGILQECEEYFMARADAWTEDGYWAQNEENRLLHEVDSALDILGNTRTDQ